MITFKEEKLKLSQLQEGKVYIIKDGRLLLYCGKINTEEYLFYLVGTVAIMSARTQLGMKTIYNFDFMHSYVVDSVINIMKKPANLNGMLTYRTIPFCVIEYPDLDFSSGLDIWLKISNFAVKGFSNKVKITSNIKPSYVKASELEVGRIYVTASIYKETYIYIGKDDLGYFRFVFIGGNRPSFLKDPYRYILNYHDRGTMSRKTKSIPKFTGIADGWENYKLDLSRLNLFN